MNTPAPLFSQTRIANNRRRARSRFAHHDFLHQRIWQDLIERTLEIKRNLSNAMVVGELVPKVEYISKKGWALTKHMKPSTAELDLVLSFLELHLADKLPDELVKYRRSLKPDGVFLGALFGGHTLTELRHSLFTAECEITQGAASRVVPFVDVNTLGALVQAAGFALPVIDVDTIIVRYQSLQDLLCDLRYMGEANPSADPVYPLSRAILARAEQVYKQQFADKDGLLPARFDILYICGWAPHQSQQKPLKPGAGKMFLGDAIRKTKT